MPPQVPEPIINRCPECEQEIDVSELSPFAKTVCPHCHESIRVRTTLGVYQLTRLLGEGGMSQVFLATDTTLNREVALKVLHRSLTEKEGLAKMFEREAKLTASINHSNVVRVYTVGQDKGNFFIAMEVVDNVSLEEKISGQGMVPEAQVLEIAYDVALGLRAAFQAGLIHRDIKPGNILLTQDGAAKLVDFGLALAHEAEDEVEDVWATPFYVPPEKLDGEPDDFRGDIYSLGATLFHAVAGSPPFDANTASMQDLKEIKAQPLKLTDAAPHASAQMAKLIDKMMSYNPAKRQQSYDELVGEIDALLEDSAGSGSRAGKRVGERNRSKSGTSKLLTVGIAVAVLAIAIGAYVVKTMNDNGGDISTPILPGGGERVLGGGANAGQLFQQAREALVAGNFDSAHSQFSELLGSEDLKQPTRGWTRFNAALSLLLEGKEPEARSLFAELREPDGFPQDGSEEETQEFFRKIGELAGDPLPVMDDAHEKFGEDSMDCLGLLVCGLKNWNSEEFESGARYLTRFLDSKPPSNFSWVASYQPLAKPFIEDLKIVNELPRPERDLEAAELAEMEKRLTLSLDALQTNGAGRKLARLRLGRVKRFLAEPPPKPPVKVASNNSGNTPGGPGSNGNGGGEMDAAAVAEVEAFRAVQTEVSPIAARYKFADAAARWDVAAGSYQSPTAKQLSGLEREACRHAEDFVRGVTTWLGQGQYDDRVHGQVERREGRPLDAKITAADRESVIVDLGFGPNRVPVEDLAPAWMLRTAREHILTGAAQSAEGDPENWVRAVWFARQTGLTEEADAMAKELAATSEPFKQNWEMLKSGGTTGSAAGSGGGGGNGGNRSGSDASRGAFQQPGMATPGGSPSSSGEPKSLGGSIFKGDATPQPE